MKNNQYYRFLIFVVLCVVSINLQAQSDSLLRNSDMRRKGFKLAVDVSNDANGDEIVVLEKEQLQTILSDVQFHNYKVARRCYVASIPLLAYGVSYFTVSAICLGIGLYNAHYHPNAWDFSLFISEVTFGMSIPFLISGTILITNSAKKLNNIVEGYNKQRHLSHFQNGLQLNFGVVNNGIGVRLRF
jgi:hypothetical protein